MKVEDAFAQYPKLAEDFRTDGNMMKICDGRKRNSTALQFCGELKKGKLEFDLARSNRFNSRTI